MSGHWDGRLSGRQSRRADGERHAGGRATIRPGRDRVSQATEVGNAKASGGVLALQGTDDEFIATFDTLIGKLEAQGDDLQYVILPGQRHDYALQFGWPWAKAFFEDRLPLR